MEEKNNILPQKNSYFLGQNEAEELFLRAWKSSNLHHAWLISGPKGIGKATLAYRIARFLFWADWQNKDKYSSLNVSETEPVFQQVANGSYPDLKVLERDYIETDRKKILSAIRKGEYLNEEDLSNLKKSAYIRIDEVRRVGDFLSKTSFNDGWRVVIIDSVDDMNKNSANGLLKMLEEPPSKTVLLLISHNPGGLLPTIRSRCAKLQLRELEEKAVASLLRRYRPELNETEIAAATAISGGSIGKAIRYSDNDAATMYNELCSILYAKRKFSLRRLLDFVTQCVSDTDRFLILEELILKFVKDNMTNCNDVEAMYSYFKQTQQMFDDCANVNMDKRQMLINLLGGICKVL